MFRVCERMLSLVTYFVFHVERQRIISDQILLLDSLPGYRRLLYRNIAFVERVKSLKVKTGLLVEEKHL